MRVFFLPILVCAVASAQKPANVSDDRLSSTGLLAKQRIAAAANLPNLPTTTSCVNEPDCPEGPVTLSSLQAETSIAVDSTGQHIVIGFNDFRGFSVGPQTSISGYIYSDDGGNTFVDGGQLPVGPTTVVGGQVVPQLFGDPM